MVCQRRFGTRTCHETTGPGELKEVKVLSPAVKQTIDLEFLEKAGQWMEDSVSKDEPFFVYFNHSLVHFPTVAREEYQGTSNGGEVADCLQQLDGDFQTLLDKIEELGVRAVRLQDLGGSLTTIQPQGGNVTAVVIHEADQVSVAPSQPERHDVALPQLVGTGPFEEPGLGWILYRLAFGLVYQPLLGQGFMYS
jgi:hypothetical protein